jgi:adenosylmethionine-8-amino-7-oxononanoate aminotransferase
MFACEQARITPDFLCLSKGLTGGYLPLSAVLTRESIYDAFYAEFTAQRAFLHSHSYTGNALGCAAARATLGIFFNGPVLETNQRLAAHMAERLGPLAAHPHVADVRQTGMIAAIEFVRDQASREPFPWHERRGLILHRHALERGVLLRPIGNVVYFMPPYVITPAEIDLMVEVAIEGIDRACA